MSFLAGRLAGKEGAYFLQESKHAVGRIVEKNSKSPNSSSQLPIKSPQLTGNEADVLPEVLRHSLPSGILRPPSESSLATGSKWVLPSGQVNVSSVSPDALNPLRGYVSLPQVTFGPKRWQLPNSENSTIASTANELRQDKYTPLNPDKLKAATAGLSQIGKAFAVATALVFGGATLTFGLAASKLDMRTSDDIRTKGKDLVQPQFDMIRERVTPIRTWAEGKSKNWHREREENMKEKPLIKELSKMLGPKTPN